MIVKKTTSGRVGRDDEDCAIRALVNATKADYTEVRNLLRRHGYRYKQGFELQQFLEEWDPFGYTAKKEIFVGRGYKGGITVEKFVNYYHKGIWILNLKYHVVCVRNGIVYDTHDPADLAPAKVYTAYQMQKLQNH